MANSPMQLRDEQSPAPPEPVIWELVRPPEIPPGFIPDTPHDGRDIGEQKGESVQISGAHQLGIIRRLFSCATRSPSVFT